jgi:hypothetical protein
MSSPATSARRYRTRKTNVPRESPLGAVTFTLRPPFGRTTSSRGTCDPLEPSAPAGETVLSSGTSSLSATAKSKDLKGPPWTRSVMRWSITAAAARSTSTMTSSLRSRVSTHAHAGAAASQRQSPISQPWNRGSTLILLHHLTEGSRSGQLFENRGNFFSRTCILCFAPTSTRRFELRGWAPAPRIGDLGTDGPASLAMRPPEISGEIAHPGHVIGEHRGGALLGLGRPDVEPGRSFAPASDPVAGCLRDDRPERSLGLEGAQEPK